METSNLPDQFIVTIDGPAGSGKSTVAKQLAQELNFTYLDSGAMFRAITFKAMEEELDLTAEEKIADMVARTRLDIQSLPTGTKVILDGRDVSGKIRSPEVSRNVSAIAPQRPTRDALRRLQQEFARNKRVIAEGRDMGTVVFPDAQVKIFLVASIEERVRRRMKDFEAQGSTVSETDLRREIEDRDKADTNRELAPLKAANDAVKLDTSSLPIDEVVDKIKAIVREKTCCSS